MLKKLPYGGIVVRANGYIHETAALRQTVADVAGK